MRKELDKKLVKDFPLLFCDRYGNKSQTAMCWGFECGDGWEPVIRKAAEQLEALISQWIKDNPENFYHPRASQIKEKFGTLRFYLSHGTDEMYKITDRAEYESQALCEECGKKGKLRHGGWMVTLCDKCTLKRRGTLEEVDLP